MAEENNLSMNVGVAAAGLGVAALILVGSSYIVYSFATGLFKEAKPNRARRV